MLFNSGKHRRNIQSLSQHQQQPGDSNGYPNYIQYERQRQGDFTLHSIAGSSGDPSIVTALEPLARDICKFQLRTVHLRISHPVLAKTSIRLLSYPADSLLTYYITNTRHPQRIPR